MAGIRWGRGFFRVWMLIAIIWVGVGMFVGGWQLMHPYVSRQVLAIPADTGAVTLYSAYGREHNDLRTLVTAKTMTEHPIGPEGYPLFLRAEAPPDRVAARIAEAEPLVAEYIESETVAQRSKAIPGVLAGVILPPLTILLIGWAIGWAVTGFRRAA